MLNLKNPHQFYKINPKKYEFYDEETDYNQYFTVIRRDKKDKGYWFKTHYKENYTYCTSGDRFWNDNRIKNGELIESCNPYSANDRIFYT